MGSLRDKCGVGFVNSCLDAYGMLRGLEHRGEETTGIAGMKDKEIYAMRWLGKVYNKNYEDIEKIRGEQFAIHTRYATQGSKDEILRDAHPITLDGYDSLSTEKQTSFTKDASSAIVYNGQVVGDKIFPNEIESDTELLLRTYKEYGIHKLMEEIPGSYSMIILDEGNVIGCRDRYGIKPLWYGKKDGLPVLCSEDFPIKKIGGKPIREVDPGEMVYIEDGKVSFEKVVEPEEKFCFFEKNYLSNPNSTFKGRKNWDTRKSLGEKLAEEFEIEADIVMDVPNTGKPYAIGYSEKSGIRYLPELKKKKFQRSFIQSTKEKRRKSIKENLYFERPEILHEKRVVFVDDSIIRGNVLERVIEISEEAGVEKIYYLSGTPPVGRDENCFCCYGVDMPKNDEFIMRRYGNEREIEKYLSEKYGIPFELDYISQKGLFDVLGDQDKYCKQCITGEKPIKLRK